MMSANSGFPDDEVAVVLNNGTGRFGAPIETVIPDYPLDVAGADFDEDGVTDLAMATLGTTMVLLADGDGTFTVTPASGDDANTVADADFDGDGNADFAITVYEFPNSFVKVFFGNGNGTFDPPVSYSSSVASDMDHLFAVDLESDGDADLVYSDGSTVFTRENGGDGAFGPQLSDVGSGERGNGHGLPGRLTATPTLSRWMRVGATSKSPLGDGAGGFTKIATYDVIATQGLYVTTGEFTGDGRVDVVAGDDNDVVVLMRGRGDGRLSLFGRYLTGGYDLIGVDVSGDGRDDVVGHSLRPSELSVAAGTGAGLLALTCALVPRVQRPDRARRRRRRRADRRGGNRILRRRVWTSCSTGG